MGGRKFSRGTGWATCMAGIGLGVLCLPSVASAAKPAAETPTTVPEPTVTVQDERARRERRRLFSLETNAVVTRELVPTTFLGLDAAIVLGNDTFALRAGGAVLGAASFRLAANEVSNLLVYGLLDACAGKKTRQHRIRMCIGGELGGWKHYWSGYGQADTEGSQHVAGTLKGDYRYAFTRNFGLLLGVGMSIPAVGPQFRGRDPQGRVTPVLVPGPIAGTLRIGGTFGFG
ncbi:MAG: hypothetical protein KUG77_12450 [Nannocystaceae bacterium]|nr:hypothetical protein [Nannocystaceae bacterium]